MDRRSQLISQLGIVVSVAAAGVAAAVGFSGLFSDRSPSSRRPPAIERTVREKPAHHPHRGHRIVPRPGTSPLATEVAALSAQSQHNAHKAAHIESSLREVRGILLDNPKAAVSYTLLKHEVSDNQEKANITLASLESRLDDENSKLEWIVGVLALGLIGIITSVVVTRR